MRLLPIAYTAVLVSQGTPKDSLWNLPKSRFGPWWSTPDYPLPFPPLQEKSLMVKPYLWSITVFSDVYSQLLISSSHHVSGRQRQHSPPHSANQARLLRQTRSQKLGWGSPHFHVNFWRRHSFSKTRLFLQDKTGAVLLSIWQRHFYSTRQERHFFSKSLHQAINKSYMPVQTVPTLKHQIERPFYWTKQINLSPHTPKQKDYHRSR